MPSFSLITEGLTDQVLITFLLTGYYGDTLEVTEAQPLRDETDESRQGSHAGWENVLDYCSTELFEQQFYVNDYVIIQIDSDVCGTHKKFDLPLKDGGKDKPVEEIIELVQSHIVGFIGKEIYDRYAERIIFAISIHSLECWLLPAYGKTKIEKEKSRKCEMHLTEILERFDVIYEKTYRVFNIICKPFLVKKTALAAAKSNKSLNLFLGSLPEEK